MGSTAFVQVDAFTDVPFGGNPAAVIVLEGPADDAWMQSVALEMNLSETAFCHPSAAVDGEWDLRWLTPTTEVDLCGHATLATAHVLASEHGVTGEMAFHTRSGRLAAEVVEGGIRLDFPADEVTHVPATPEIVHDLQTIEWDGKSVWSILTDAGVRMTENAGCSACLGGPVDTFGRMNEGGQKCISATNRNFPGRMGSKESEIYLASPVTVAASALAGHVADPRDYLN